MRFRFALSLALTYPLLAAGPKPVPARELCKTRCDSEYQLCLKRAANGEGRKNCKVFRKTCSKGCPPK